jgi:ubiquinone/menaquinone biosynthesis C-methylase UbiE
MTDYQPPICDYEGSEYQREFWEEGGRAYEDAVEEIAIQKLMPVGGKRLLELGAGAGRNTLRYHGFEEIVLLDYSTTQLAQAKHYLGNTGNYRFVAADIYHMPFVDGLFDTATMIRTLHHMQDGQQVIHLVRDLLEKDAVFVLEYANKHNLKAMLRYLLHQQKWSPYTLEQVEFVELNYDFHPKAIRQWLYEANFAMEKQLTVSHFRMGFLKRLIPTNLLVALDRSLQWTGDFVQVSPSVFTRNRAIGASAAAKPGEFFCCSICRTAIEDTPPLLHCPKCGKTYPVENGIYNFKLNTD